MKRLVRPSDSASWRRAACTLALLAAPANVFAADYFVSSAAEIASTLRNFAEPGDTLIMANGTWTNQTINFSDDGSAENPITLRAETPGQVILNGNSTLNISGDWLVVDGLTFAGGSLSDGSNAIVEFRGSNGVATNSRFTNSAIIGYNPPHIDDRYHWVELFGHNNRVDHNRFQDQDHSGVTVVVRRDNGSANRHLIDNNHFVDRPQPSGASSSNGFETIRVGTSNTSLSDSFTVVQNNLFERTDGEIEIISNKSGNNTFQYNTFRESAGTLTLRHGNDNRVAGNFFLGENKDRSGAIRVIGERQTVVNNYIANVDDRAGGSISLSAGVENSDLNQYFQVKDAVIAHNTLVNTAGTMITFDNGLGSSNRTLLAENVTVANNLLKSSGRAIFEGSEGSGWTWEGNIAFGGSLGPKASEPGIAELDPQLQLDGTGLWRPSGASPAIDSGHGSYSGLLAEDMDGQARLGLFDVGADEFAAAAIVRKPLQPTDVGPHWLVAPVDPPIGGGPSGDGCLASGCAIQAESYSAILDPDSDGQVWREMNVADALGGEVLVAPNGSRINLPTDLHDTIATYDLSFSEAGTYRAYYRARGFNGSSDSVYVPADFATDPDVAETLSSDGSFRWESGGTFTITAAHVGMPLEFRVARREATAELDALVLNLDLALSAAELDALFDIVTSPADFNEDGIVDALDLHLWQAGFGKGSGATLADGDADADGDVDSADFHIWQQQFTTAAPVPIRQVPEPTCATLLLLGCRSLLRCSGSRQRCLTQS